MLLQGQLINLILFSIVDEDTRARPIRRQCGTNYFSACSAVEVFLALNPLPNSEDGANCPIRVDNRRAIKWIKGNDILTISAQVSHLRPLFRKASIDDACVTQGFKDERIGLHIHVELNLAKLISRVYFVRQAISHVEGDFLTCIQNAVVNFLKVSFCDTDRILHTNV